MMNMIAASRLHPLISPPVFARIKTSKKMMKSDLDNVISACYDSAVVAHMTDDVHVLSWMF